MKILIELDYETTRESVGGSVSNHFITKLSHPDLNGHLYLRSSSDALAEVQLKHLNKASVDTDVETTGDPIHTLLTSVNKLVDGFSELKETFKK